MPTARDLMMLEMQLAAALKKVKAEFDKTQPENPAFGHASVWSKTPRAGARWTPDEKAALLEQVKNLDRPLMLRDICQMAWHHGRSPTAIADTLISLRYGNLVFNAH